MPWAVKATYDNFALIGEDISPIVRNLSPFETPFLELLSEPPGFATSTDHQWTEEALGPDTLITSIALNSVAAGDSGTVVMNGFAQQLQVGMTLELQSNAAGVQNELMRISSIGAGHINSFRVTRAVDGSAIGSLAVGGQITVISTAELEGSTTSGDVNRPRTRRRNYCQIFKKPISITGTDRAVMYAPDLGDEFDHQTVLRTRELMRDLEKAVFRGRLSGNSIGSGSAYRTMGGLREFVTTINSAVVGSSFTADPLLYTNNVMQQAWNNGARDIDIIVAGATFKRDLSAIASATRIISTDQSDRSILSFKDQITTDFGTARLVLSPWLNATEMYGVSSQRLFVVPLRTRSFQFERIGKTGDSETGHVIGEYTMEIHHPDKMFHLFV